MAVSGRPSGQDRSRKASSSDQGIPLRLSQADAQSSVTGVTQGPGLEEPTPHDMYTRPQAARRLEHKTDAYLG